MTQLQSSSFHEHGSSSGAPRFHSVASVPELFFAWLWFLFVFTHWYFSYLGVPQVEWKMNLILIWCFFLQAALLP